MNELLCAALAVILFVSRRLEPHTFRTSIAVYFILIDLAALAVLVQVGEIGWLEVRTSFPLLPAAKAGTLAGRKLVSRVPVGAFRRVVLIMMLLAGVVGMADSLRDVLTCTADPPESSAGDRSDLQPDPSR